MEEKYCHWYGLRVLPIHVFWQSYQQDFSFFISRIRRWDANWIPFLESRSFLMDEKSTFFDSFSIIVLMCYIHIRHNNKNKEFFSLSRHTKKIYSIFGIASCLTLSLPFIAVLTCLFIQNRYQVHSSLFSRLFLFVIHISLPKNYIQHTIIYSMWIHVRLFALKMKYVHT